MDGWRLVWGYLKKQKADILAFKRDESLIIPKTLNYDVLSGLSNEVKSKFKKIRHQIKEGETFDNILSQYQIDKEEIQNLKMFS